MSNQRELAAELSEIGDLTNRGIGQRDIPGIVEGGRYSGRDGEGGSGTCAYSHFILLGRFDNLTHKIPALHINPGIVVSWIGPGYARQDAVPVPPVDYPIRIRQRLPDISGPDLRDDDAGIYMQS